ncbi:MAG: divalent-cation tolerance protein CutA [Proteobacteria bacterium]|nr:divalent-cation tolerance protein CutA [Pseudomonadota bacterium]MBU1649401.1 divalent-cation tolerance protein CutA [Pseudomonadota bacterium]
MSLPLLISTTFESRVDADKMASMLLEKRFIACAQITGPIRSTYWWQGEIVSSEEYLLVMKSDESLYNDLEQVIREFHSYETPEIIATAITHLSEDYRQWLEKELQI